MHAGETVFEDPAGVELLNHLTNHRIDHCTNHPANHLTNYRINHCTNHPANHRTNHATV